MAGEGAAFAMAGAYTLAGELHRMGTDIRSAMRNYEQTLRPLIERKQRSALRLGHWFAPRTRMGLIARNQIMRMMSSPWVARWFMGSMIDDRFTLPAYQP
jgi:2-polyprenyl-6-methoxyphenol hydroxylase-like FAD-dependent oxidoreductase